jgi:predicted CxxxxCH...CXXCH cytochrome family protein
MAPRAGYCRRHTLWSAASFAPVLAWLTLGCQARVLSNGAAPQFAADVQPILEASCARCHGGDAPDAGWSVQSYLSTIACTKNGEPVTVAGDDGVPILRVLEQKDHKALLDVTELDRLRTWVDAGAPSRDAAMHPVGWLDPRSGNWHGKALRDEGFARMLRLGLRGACGKCHRGAPAQDPKLTNGPASAPSCTSCHSADNGVLACGTCHGDGADRAYPPRDPCYFPNGPAAGAHRAHVSDSKLRAGQLACTTCHPAVEADRLIAGSHADGKVDIVLDPKLAGADASYDAKAGTCTVVCHSHKGARATPSWTKDEKLGCGDCHASPPSDHYPGPCSKCHPGVNDDGSALTDNTLHMNGRVDLGRDGSERCGSCHGAGEDPWPTTGAHPAHRNPSLSTNVACTSCHQVPVTVRQQGHIDGSVGAEVTFSGLATARGAQPSYDADKKTCSEVACHGAQLLGSVAATPRWHDAQPGDAQCGSCHLVPPGAPHPRDQTCEATICHGAEISIWPDGPRLTTQGRAWHVNGEVDVGTR